MAQPMEIDQSNDNDENYFIKKAKENEQMDPCAAKAWILTAKSLSPNNFSIQFAVYKQEMADKNYVEAAKCFSYIVLTFQNQPPELRQEINQLTLALRAPDEKIRPEHEFYVEMFQHISYDVQNHILKSLKHDSDNCLDYCQFVLLLMKKFSQMSHVQLPHLLEALVQNTSVANQKSCIKMLLFEVVPFIVQKPPNDLPTNLVHRILSLGLEFYTSQIFLFNNGSAAPVEFSDTANLTTPVCWARIFEIVDVCGRILKWEPFLPYLQNWSKDIYWQKLYQIVSMTSTRPSENKQILFYGTILFVSSLYEYINDMKAKIDDSDVRVVLIEAVSDEDKSKSHHTSFHEHPNIISNPLREKETAILFRTAVQCWQLLQSNEILQMDFKQLLLSLPCSQYCNQFLVDLAFYMGQPDEAKALLNDSTLGTSALEKNLRHLSLTLHQPTFQVSAFDLILKIISELPHTNGKYLKNLTSNIAGRSMVFLPLAKKPVLQYCTKILIKSLKFKMENDHPKINDATISCILVLIQLNYPSEAPIVETILNHIWTKRSLSYPEFTTYIICADLLEEFMHIYSKDSGIKLEINMPATNSVRRIGTRGSDKGIKDEFRQLIRKQMARSAEDIDALIIHYITQERANLKKLLFDS